ncbi:MAG: 30S ribosome-binding factor RbfA [Acidimicrobiales bacterium]
MPGRRRDHSAHAPYPRTARVNELLREVLAEAIERMADTDDRLSMVTVTGVRTTSDLSHAVVYLSSLGEPASAALEGMRAELQHEVGSQVRMKRTPHLEFSDDPAVAAGSRVEEILRRISSRREREGEGASGDLED